MGEICVSENTFNSYLLLLALLVAFLFYVQFKKSEQMSNIELNNHLSQEELIDKIKKLQNDLYKAQKSEQICQSDLYETKQQLYSNQKYNNRISNPLEAPERTYSGGRINIPSYNDYQQVGFLYNNDQRYPLFGRPKYPGRTDKYEYYIIDESRNRLKIPLETKNYNEIYDGDDVNIDVLNNVFQAKLYEYESLRYNPNVY